MKKFITISGILIALAILFSVNCFASNEIQTTLVATDALVCGAEGVAETVFASEMIGRAGAYTVSGGKGIALEVIYCAKDNISNLVKSIFGAEALTTSLSESSIDPIADIVTKDSAGNILDSYQCKSGTSSSQLYNTVSGYASGKYSSAELLGTTEFAESFNTYCEKNGLSYRATDSGIPEDLIDRVANEFLKNNPSFSKVLENAGKETVIFTVIATAAAIIESAINGDDFSHTIANIVDTDLAVAIPVFLQSLARQGVKIALVTAGAGTAATGCVPFIVSLTVGAVTTYVLCNLSNKYNFEETVAECVDCLIAELTEFGLETVTFLCNTYEEVAEFACLCGNRVADTAVVVAEEAADIAQTSVAWIADTATDFGVWTAVTFTNFGTKISGCICSIGK